ncbi:hypothetical protein [Paenibacillus alkalitolerans]|uniref:hypothetical protein n=1 Tax=Paenibacillus alkalitolerans TaxID=2799335 RepID=UPI0018F71337|nr:hypothetical protein [Paenibacillus alkalitolerans]
MQNQLLMLAIGVIISIAGIVAVFLGNVYFGMTLIIVGTVLEIASLIRYQKTRR